MGTYELGTLTYIVRTYSTYLPTYSHTWRRTMDKVICILVSSSRIFNFLSTLCLKAHQKLLHVTLSGLKRKNARVYKQTLILFIWKNFPVPMTRIFLFFDFWKKNLKLFSCFDHAIRQGVWNVFQNGIFMQF